MTQIEPIRVGIVGVGEIATHTHLPLWLRMKKQVDVVALCDNNLETLRKASERFKVKTIYSNIDNMIKNEALDLIDVCTSPITHKNLCLRVLRAGINCIVEKPFTTNLADANELIEVASEENVNLFAIYNYSFLPAIRKAKDLVQNGELGDIVQIDIRFSAPVLKDLPKSNHWVYTLPGGLFGELAPHPCHILAEFLDSEVQDVNAQIIKKLPHTFILGDELAVLVRTQNRIGSFSVSLNCPTSKMIISIMGSKFWLFVDAEAQTIVKYSNIQNSEAVFSRGIRAMSDIFQRIDCLARVSFGVITGRYEPSIEGHKYLIESAIRALRGEGTYPVSLDVIRKGVKILEDAFKRTDIWYSGANCDPAGENGKRIIEKMLSTVN